MNVCSSFEIGFSICPFSNMGSTYSGKWVLKEKHRRIVLCDIPYLRNLAGPLNSSSMLPRSEMKAESTQYL